MHTVDIDIGKARAMTVEPTGVRAADRLSFAAAPTFAIMALLTGVLGGKPDVLCAAIQGTSPLTGTAALPERTRRVAFASLRSSA